MKKMIILLGVACTTLVGCCSLGKNQFAENYTNYTSKGLAPTNKKPEIMVVKNKSDYDHEISVLKESGATLLGTSTFNVHGYSICENHLKSLANKQGANFVIATREFTEEKAHFENVDKYVTLYDQDGTPSGGYWTTISEKRVRKYYNYYGTFMRTNTLDPIVP